MRRIFAFLILIAISLGTFTSCRKEVNPRESLEKFISAYGAEGVIYSPEIPEGNLGFIPDGLIEKIYLFSGRFPESFAIFLNSRPEYGYECGVFLCDDADSLEMMEEVCIERTGLLDGGGERSLIIRSGNLIFYSTMKDRDRAEKLWREIIKKI